MKKTLRIMAIAMVALMLCLSLTSCFGKKLSGTYEAEVDLFLVKATYEYTFKGKNVTLVVTKDAIGTSEDKNTYEGTYEITELDNGDMEITFNFENEGEGVKSGTVSFEEGEDYIKIGGVTYNAVED